MTGLADSIGKLALSAYRKVPGVGPRATKVGNACVWALGEIPGETSLAALAILKVRVKYCGICGTDWSIYTGKYSADIDKGNSAAGRSSRTAWSSLSSFSPRVRALYGLSEK